MDKRQQNRYPTATAFIEALRYAVHGSLTVASSSDDSYAIGLFVDIRPRASSEMDDDAIDSVAARALERADEYMQQGGLVIAACTNNTILGMQLLGSKPDHSQTKRYAVLDLARRLRGSFTHDASVHVNMTLHVDRVTVCHVENGEPEITSGVLARTETWAPTNDVDGLCATPEFLGGLDNLAVEPGPEGLFVIGA